MTPKDFFDKVVEMRAAQKEYFRCRTSAALSKSKRLEAEIDREIKRANDSIPKGENPPAVTIRRNRRRFN